MARYINEDEFVAWVKEHWCADCQNDNGLRCRACWIDDAIDIVEEAPEADVVPRAELAVRSFQDAATIYDLQKKLVVATEVLKYLLSDLKKEIHDKAVYPNVNGVEPYIPVARVDALIQRYIDMVKEGK